MHTVEKPIGGGGGAILFGQNLKGYTIFGFTFIAFLLASFSKIMTIACPGLDLNLDLNLVDQC
jgi:hypothetical protein